MNEYLKFTGKYSVLKNFGFAYHLLYNNNIFYTTYDTINYSTNSNIWIRKSGNYVFDNELPEYHTTTPKILRWAISEDFPNKNIYNLVWNMKTKEIEKLDENKRFDKTFGREYFDTHYELKIRAGTIATLGELYFNGFLEFVLE